MTLHAASHAIEGIGTLVAQQPTHLEGCIMESQNGKMLTKIAKQLASVSILEMLDLSGDWRVAHLGGRGLIWRELFSFAFCP